MKVLTGILGVLAVIACLSTVGIVGYTIIGGGGENSTQQAVQTVDESIASPLPTQTPDTADAQAIQTPESISEEKTAPATAADHVHDYTESVELKATCYQAGKLKYTCEVCGDVYYVDVLSTGHVAEDDWETVREATQEKDGLRVRKCIYCDEVVAQEVVKYTDTADPSSTPHVHDYMATVEREATCVLAGLRKYTCSCGSFYTEQIPAKGHVATDWTVAEAATSTTYGTEQRTCTVCGTVLDSRSIPPGSSSASPSGSASASASSTASASASASSTATASASASASASAASTSTASASASASASGHVHSYTSYVLKAANCTEKGVRSYICSTCGSSRAEEIELDLNNHTYRSTVIAPTATSSGYTLYRCIRCNASYMDNYTEPTGA